MCWGIIVESLAEDHWWARYFGRSLINAISGSVPNEVDPITEDVLRWAREQVGLGTDTDVG